MLRAADQEEGGADQAARWAQDGARPTQGCQGKYSFLKLSTFPYWHDLLLKS